MFHKNVDSDYMIIKYFSYASYSIVPRYLVSFVHFDKKESLSSTFQFCLVFILDLDDVVTDLDVVTSRNKFNGENKTLH